MQKSLGGPAHKADGFLPRQPGDVGQPSQGFDTHGAAYRQDQLPQSLIGQLTAEWSEGLFDPGDGPALAQRQRSAPGGRLQ
jgi:hypothetical protein